MKPVLILALGGIALGIAAPAWSQEVVECSTPVTAGATCPGLVTVDIYSNALAPTGSDSGTSPSLSGNSVSLINAMSPNPDNVFGAVNVNTANTNDLTGNYAIIDGQATSSVVFGGYTTGTGDVTGNFAVLQAGASADQVYGGSGVGPGDITGNTVRISSSKVVNFIFGGAHSGDTTLVTGNTVIIGGASTLSSTLTINGGMGACLDCFTDNLLQLEDYTGTQQISSVQNFERYKFEVSNSSLPLKASLIHFSGSTPSGTVYSTVDAVSAVSGIPLTRQKMPLICGTSLPETLANNGKVLSGNNYAYSFSTVGGNTASGTASAFRISQETDTSLSTTPCVYATMVPTLSAGSAPVTTPSSAHIYVKSDMAGVSHWEILEPPGACPAASAIAAGAGHDMIFTPGVETDFYMSLPDPDADYTVCVVLNAQNAIGELAGAYSEPLRIDLHTASPDPAPTLSNGMVTSTDDSSAQFSIGSDIAILALWTAVSQGTPCPSLAELSTRAMGGDPTVFAGMSIAAPYSIQDAATGLNADTDYTLCFSAVGMNGVDTSDWSAPFRTSGGTPPAPQPSPSPSPSPSPTPEPVFSDDDTLAAGSSYAAPAGNSGFCLGGNPGSAPVTLIIDDLPYTITPEAENTCFEVFAAGTGRALILDSGSADISSIVPGSSLLEARNGDLVTGSGKIRATVDSTCTSTRVTILEGEIEAPSWITSPMPASGCPEDALTPPKGRFMVSDGKLACPPSALAIKGTWAKLTVKHTQSLGAGQQLFAVAGYAPAGWFQNNGLHGWESLDNPLLPLDSATGAGSMTDTLVDRLDVRGILGAELYSGHGADVDEMMRNGRYCGVFRVAP
ncbi:MAG: hypothetical protein FWD77_03365 [Betaproteobacteria bacterium]|nr:hypothetical protein [Betaproteobacteria bacterium]